MGQESSRKLLAEKLYSDRQNYTCTIPLRSKSDDFANQVLSLLFPQLSETKFSSVEEVAAEITAVVTALGNILQFFGCRTERPLTKVVDEFMEVLPKIHAALKLDAEAIHQGDPAAESVDEVIVAYPGFLAIAVHRLAHYFYCAGVPIFPRMLAEYAHRTTGIDIHPGAEIGESFYIDHGTGIVIGETAVIGKHVKIYQGVTLGALSVRKGLTGKRRHPTVENNVVIYSNATILGGETVIGQNSIIGGNVWITESVPANSSVYNKSEIKVRSAAPDWSI